MEGRLDEVIDSVVHGRSHGKAAGCRRMSQTIGAALRQAIRCLERHGVSEPQAAAEVLLS